MNNLELRLKYSGIQQIEVLSSRKTKSFDELFSGSYLPLAVREERARFSAGLLGEQANTKPTPPDKTIPDPSSTVNNTQHFK